MSSFPSKALVFAHLNKALEILAVRDRYLVERTLNERTVTHKLAEYLQSLFPEWNVDCEYNRNGPDQKTVYIPNQDMELEDSPVYPDIIVHLRGDWRNVEVRPHLLVIEARKLGSTHAKIERDEAKVSAYMSDLKYLNGALIEYYFQEGKVHYSIDFR